MSNIKEKIGIRIRDYRIKSDMSQEVLAEKADLHPTYISQLERGVKNATLVSIEKVSRGLDVSLSELFKNIEEVPPGRNNSIALRCYEFMLSKSSEEQRALLDILLKIDELRNK